MADELDRDQEIYDRDLELLIEKTGSGLFQPPHYFTVICAVNLFLKKEEKHFRV